MATRYKRSLIIGGGNFGDIVCTKIIDEISPLFLALNPILSCKNLNEVEIKEQIKKNLDLIRKTVESDEHPDITNYSLPGSGTRDLLSFNIILITETLDELTKLYENLRDVRKNFCGDHNIDERSIRNFGIFNKGETHKEYPADLNYIMSKNLSSSEEFSGNIENAVSEFLFFLIFSHLWSVANRDFSNQTLFNSEKYKFSSLGIKSHYLPISKIGKFFSSKLIVEFINKALGKSDPDVQDASKTIRENIPAVRPVNNIEDLKLKEVAKPPFTVDFGFFSTKKSRKDKLKGYIASAENNIEKYFKDKKESTKSYRMELDNRLGKFSDEEKEKLIDKIKEESISLNESKKLLSETIGNNSKNIPNIKQEIENKSKQIKWKTFTNYSNIPSPEITPNPIWKTILILFALIIIPFALKNSLLFFIPFKYIFTISVIFLISLTIYVFICLNRLKSMELTLKKNYYNILKQIDEFFDNNIDSLKVLYSKSFLEKILKRCEEELEFLNNKVKKFENYKKGEEQIAENIKEELDIFHNTYFQNFVSEILGNISLEKLYKNIPNVSKLWNWNKENLDKKKDELKKVSKKYMNKNFDDLQGLFREMKWIEDIKNTYNRDKPNIMSNGQPGREPLIVFFSDENLKKEWNLNAENVKFISVERPDMMGVIRFGALSINEEKK